MPCSGTQAWNTPINGWDQLHLAGVGAGVVNVPALRRLGTVSVIAGAALATYQIGAMPAVTVPPGCSIDEDFDGGLLVPAGPALAITLVGDVASYLITYWEPP